MTGVRGAPPTAYGASATTPWHATHDSTLVGWLRCRGPGRSSVSAADAQTVDDLLGNIDLSEAAFARMTAKIKEMQAIKVRGGRVLGRRVGLAGAVSGACV